MGKYFLRNKNKTAHYRKKLLLIESHHHRDAENKTFSVSISHTAAPSLCYVPAFMVLIG